ncbi:MAG: diacylglycerol kinase family protein [Chloroflexota bacterium]
MQAAIVFNPLAGTRRAMQDVGWAVEALQARGWPVALMPTERPGQMGELAAAAVADGARAIFAAGGDGTVGAVAEALAGTETVLGVLPIGTANVWAAELGLNRKLSSPQAVRACIDAQVDGAVRAVDMGRRGSRAFLLWAGIGLDGHVISKIEPRPEIAKRFGNTYFFWAGLIGATDFRGGAMTVRTEQGTMSGKNILAVVTNVRLYGGNGADSVLEPEAKVDDGQLAVWTMGGESFFDALIQLNRYRHGGHLHHHDAQKLNGREIEIELERPMLVQFDGELAGAVNHARFTVWPGALRVFAPDRLLQIFG